MTLDILSALEATPSRGERKCKLAAFLDEIPTDAPGRDELLGRVEDAAAFPAQTLTLTFAALGHPVSSDTISNHRAKRCRCYR